MRFTGCREAILWLAAVKYVLDVPPSDDPVISSMYIGASVLNGLSEHDAGDRVKGLSSEGWVKPGHLFIGNDRPSVKKHFGIDKNGLDRAPEALLELALRDFAKANSIRIVRRLEEDREVFAAEGLKGEMASLQILKLGRYQGVSVLSRAMGKQVSVYADAHALLLFLTGVLSAASAFYVKKERKEYLVLFGVPASLQPSLESFGGEKLSSMLRALKEVTREAREYLGSISREDLEVFIALSGQLAKFRWEELSSVSVYLIANEANTFKAYQGFTFEPLTLLGRVDEKLASSVKSWLYSLRGLPDEGEKRSMLLMIYRYVITESPGWLYAFLREYPVAIARLEGRRA